jgi:hypothetical protein
MIPLALCLLLVALGGLAWNLFRPEQRLPGVLWAWAWFFLATSAVLAGDPALSDLMGSRATHFAGPLFAAFGVAGAFLYTGRQVPAWLLPAATALAGLRGVLALSGLSEIGHGLAIAFEPATTCVAAYLVFSQTLPSPTGAQRVLPASFLLVAGVDLGSSLAGLSGHDLTAPVVWSWVAIAPFALGVQITASIQRREQLGRRQQDEHTKLSRANNDLSREVRARRRAEARLRTSQERYRTVSELSSDLSFSYRLEADGS